MKDTDLQKRSKIHEYFKYLLGKEDFERITENFQGIKEVLNIDKELERIESQIASLEEGYKQRFENDFAQQLWDSLSDIAEMLSIFLFSRKGCFALVVYLFSLVAFPGMILLASIGFVLYRIFSSFETTKSDKINDIAANNQYISSEISRLKHNKECLEDAKRHKLEIIEVYRTREKEIESRFSYFLDIENEIDQWFEEDKEYIISAGLKKLKINGSFRGEPDEFEFYDSQVVQEPIVIYRPLTSERVEKNYILFGNFDVEIQKGNSIDTYVNKSDFYSIKGFDGRYRNSVFEFVVIYLTGNFLSCYKCYWNFLVGASSIVETHEILYDSIVSFTEYERASLRQQDPYQRRKYQERILISTSDGKRIGFRLSDDRRINIFTQLRKSAPQTSEFGRAAECIRYWLRQRRVDYQMVKRADE